MRFLRANGVVVCYRDEGPRDGPALVFINALGSDLRIWDDVARILSPDFRIVRYDKRGHGLSELGPDRCDMADYARDLAALLDALGVARATVVGLSIGGLIAQELYRQRPELFAALVLSDTAAKIGTDESWDARIADIERGGIEAIADSVLERWFTADFRARRSDELAGWRAMLTRTPEAGISRRLRGVEARGPAALRGNDSGCDALSRRRGGRFDAGPPGARDGRPDQRRPLRDRPGRGPRPEYRKARGFRRLAGPARRTGGATSAVTRSRSPDGAAKGGWPALPARRAREYRHAPF